MEYTINKLAKLAGVSTRTLRYYDGRGLLAPSRAESNGYRVYGQAEVDRLRQIMFYRELGVPLAEISRIISAEDFDAEAALRAHLSALSAKRERIDALIANVEKSLRALKGETVMSDTEKFEIFKRKLIDENTEKYSAELRAKYGKQEIEDSIAYLKGLTKEQYDEVERKRLALVETLKAAFDTGDPAGKLAREACDLHREWLSVYYPGYNKEYHKGLGEMYVADGRFRAYYDKLAPGCAEFLRDAINIYCA